MMYNLLVTAEEGAWNRPNYAFEVDRYLEYTEGGVKARFTTLDEVTMDVLKQLPALFAYEKVVKSAARVGRLTAIRKSGRNVTVSFTMEPAILPIAPGQLETLLAHLDIERSEMNRTHFAVKQADLLGVLQEAGLLRSREPQPGTPAIGGQRVTPNPSPATKKVFLVDGRDSGTKHEVARYLEQLGLEVTILHERPNKGRTLISKFSEEAAGISFAVVLMTPDDVGGLARKGRKRPRARQNVVFELGYFIGKLGPEHVCALVAGEVERPSDFEAVVFEKFDSRGAWRSALARELRAAGVPFDFSKVV